MAANKIIVKSPYDKDTHVQFYLFHITHKSSMIYMFPLIGLLILFLLTTGDNKDNITMYITFATFAIIFVPFYIWITIRSNVKRDSKTRVDSIETIEMTKEKITRTDDKINGKDILSWSQIMTVYERVGCFYFYTSNEHGFIVKKDDIVEGDVETIRGYCKKLLRPDKKGKVPFKQVRKIKKGLKNDNK